MNSDTIYYYEVLLLRSSAPALTYYCEEKLQAGAVVSVPLHTAHKEAVILRSVPKPEFETARIISVSERFYAPKQLEIAKFIAEYYFSSLGEAVSLFIPFRINQREVNSEKLIVHSAKVPTLTQSQQKAYTQLLKKDKALLFGVTGSGKTEIFISLMAKMLREGKTAIFLMPEISPTPQME
ncbi:MAG: DEAD/DEAH box helicase family protein, partial [Sulfurovum sp.]|nr:DEAD/DEAH box helicase family protein [Sulfurovum sp.]